MQTATQNSLLAGTNTILDAADVQAAIQNETNKLIGQMKTIYDMTSSFATKLDGVKGLAVMGPPGVGKTEQVVRALVDTNANAEYTKGAEMSAVGFYEALWLNKDKHRILVLDDFDLKNNVGATQIIGLLKSATENQYKPRVVQWLKQPSAYMREKRIPRKFEYWGQVIWITNEMPATLQKSKKLSQHLRALVGPGGRFSPVVLDWNKQQKYFWTLHLIDNQDMLGANCRSRKGGYEQETINVVKDFLKKQFDNLIDISPRFATQIAENYETWDDWEDKCLAVNSFEW